MSFIFSMRCHILRRSSTAIALCIATSACGGGNNAADPPSATDAPADVVCTVTAGVGPLPAALSEASGAAVSRTRPDLIWTHNDSGSPPELFVIDTLGAIVTRFRIDVPDAAAARDWEDIAAGDCDGADCLYVADIGDNSASRSSARILRVREDAMLRRDGADAVAGNAMSTPSESFEFRYPDGALDAEAIFVLPGERVHVVTKGRSRAVSVYRYPGRLRNELVTLEHVQDLTPGLVQLPDQVTGASAAADGSLVVIRTYAYLRRFSVAADGKLVEVPEKVDLAAAEESQGEAIAMRADGTLFLLGEKGFNRQSGTFGRAECH